MSDEAWDQFLQAAPSHPVPPPPDFDQQLHGRVNRWLLVLHTIDFVFRAAPWAWGHFAQAGWGLAWMTISGQWLPPSRRHPPQH